MSTKETIIDVLEGFFPGSDYATRTALVDERILDSLTMVAFIAELEDVLDVEIPPVEIVPDNFNSVDAMSALIDRLREEELD